MFLFSHAGLNVQCQYGQLYFICSLFFVFFMLTTHKDLPYS